MKVVIAPDKFKHSLTSLEACSAIKEGLSRASLDFEITMLPFADGGDGLSEVIQFYIAATKHPVTVFDPLFRPIHSSLLLSRDKGIAFIEMAKASGLLLLKPQEYNCLLTTTFGTGELIRKALNFNVRKIIIGIGGSATNDCGIGMAAALGYRFLDKAGKPLQPTGENLILIDRIDSSTTTDLKQVKFEVACDVSNPLTGPNGASMVYAEQKGASKEAIEQLEQGMLHFVTIIKRDLGKDLSSVPGGGAAGGLGAGCIAFLNAELKKGSDLVIKISEAERHIQQADVVLTGEGKIDEQSMNGKVLSAIGALCKRYRKPLFAFCGALQLSNEQLERISVKEAHTINEGSISKENAYKNAYQLLASKACQWAMLLRQK